MAVSKQTKPDPITGKFSRAEMDALTASIPINLPTERGLLVGRSAEADMLLAMLQRTDVRLITLAGFGGVGKTTLAMHVARRALPLFSGGVFFVDLAAINDPDLIPLAVAQTLNIQEEPNRDIWEVIRDFAGERAILFLMDNYEHLMDGVFAVSKLLDVNENIKVIATSREALRLRGERVVPIASLPREDAVRLFEERARSLNPDFHVTEANQNAVAELCEKLGGFPLAIELAAMRVRMFTPQALLSRLNSDLGTGSPLLTTLTAGARDLPKRQQTLRNTIAWSYSLLTESEQKILRTASLFRSGVGLESLVAVAGIPEVEAVDIFSSLVDKNLIQPLPGRENRFFILETIREFCLEEMIRMAEFEPGRDAFIGYYCELSKRASCGIKTSEQGDWFARFDEEHASLVTAVEWALAHPSGSPLWLTGFEILGGLGSYWMLNGHFYVGKHWIERGFAEMERFAPDANTGAEDLKRIIKARGMIYSLAGSLDWVRGEFTASLRLHQKSLAFFEEIQDESGMAEALNNMGVNAMAVGETGPALGYYTRALELSKNMGDQWGQLRLLNNLGSSYSNLNDLDNAQKCYTEGLELAQRVNNAYFVGVLYMNMAFLHINAGRLEAALEYFEKADTTPTHFRVGYMQAWFAAGRAVACIGLARKEEALANLIEALKHGLLLYDNDLHWHILLGLVGLFSAYDELELAGRMLGCFETLAAKRTHLIFATENLILSAVNRKLSANLSAGHIRALQKTGAESMIAENLRLAYDNLLRLQGVKVRTDKQAIAEDSLTAREWDVLKLLARGKSNEEISQELVVVLKTVEKHVANVLRKLGVKNRTEAAAWAVENKII